MEALMAIALICQVHCSGFLGISCSKSAVDSYQKACQKALIACYESKFPVPPPQQDQWVGGLKDCIKAR